MRLRCTLSILLATMLTMTLLSHAMFADDASHSYPLRIKVLSAESHRLGGADPVPKNCDFTNYDAYCNGSRSAMSQSVMKVQDTAGNQFTISCTVDTQWSKCVPLPVGETFEARTDERGMTVLYLGRKGKEKSQLYQIVSTLPAPKMVAAPVGAGHAAAAVTRETVERNTVSCSFSSTPTGAEISIDGQYAGSAPSRLQLTPGAHAVVLSLPGYGPWERQLTLMPGSDVNVTANLQKDEK